MQDAEAKANSQTSELKELNTTAMDTVGAIVLDLNGNLASAVSSGGILLKHPGRIGHASIYGCGCWVSESENFEDTNENKSQIAICTTGCGEHIIRTLFAKECGDFLLHNNDVCPNILDAFFQQKFFSNFFFNIFIISNSCLVKSTLK